MFNLTFMDILFIFLLFLMLEHLFEKFLLFLTTKAAIKQAGILGVTKDEILKEVTNIVNGVTNAMQEKILTDMDKKIKEEVIKLVDAENKNIALSVTKKRTKKTE